MVARDRVEPPKPASSELIPTIFQQLNRAEWPQFCDHSVTSADVRLLDSNSFRLRHAPVDYARGFEIAKGFGKHSL
jgi:hypothetical protein